MAEGFNRFPEIVAKFGPACSQIVRKSAFDVQALYAATCPRDTGFMASSAYVVTSQESTYGQGGATAPKGAYLLPEVAKPEDPYTAHVAVGANYGIYPEMGTRYQAAQPAFYPAVDAVEPSFLDAWHKLEEAL
jgi:hypothetical protein